MAKKSFVYKQEVENLINHLEKEYYRKLIDKALDEKLHVTNPEKFDKIYKVYKQYN